MTMSLEVAASAHAGVFGEQEDWKCLRLWIFDKKSHVRQQESRSNRSLFDLCLKQQLFQACSAGRDRADMLQFTAADVSG